MTELRQGIAGQALHRLARYQTDVAAPYPEFWSLYEKRYGRDDAEFLRGFKQRKARLASPEVVRRSAVVWIASDMVALLQRARQSIPEFVFTSDLLPWQNAIVFGASTLLSSEDTAMSGVQWCADSLGADRQWQLAGIDEKNVDLVTPEFVLSPGDLIGGRSEGSLWTFKATFGALWLLLRQRIAVRRTEEAPRAVRRQHQRTGREAPKDVTVIQLRQALRPSADDGSESAVDWSHRWIVDGHWRQQFHPSTGQHLPTWIAPHVKGPADKPLVVKQRVYAWVR